MRGIVVSVVAAALAGCSGEGSGVTVYLEQRLGPDGPPGQVAPVLEPTERPPRKDMGAAAQALVQLRQGATPDERARGMSAPVEPATRLRLDRIENGVAFVEVAGKPLDSMGVAAVVFSLTELPEIDHVHVCCGHRHDGSRIFVHTRASYRGWQGEPCAERRENRCLRDR